MFIEKSKFDILIKKIDDLNFALTKNNLLELAEILGNTKQMLIKNILAGISKGIGIGIGFSLLTAVLLIILKNIVTLNIPVIGGFITDIVEIVEGNRK